MGGDGALVGRVTELSVIADFLAAARGGGLVLLGESGSGKTALWHSARREAVERGALTLVATPGEHEGRFSGSVLLDLLGAIDLDGVLPPGPLRHALDVVCLRREAADPPRPQVVSVAVREVLAHLARERQVVVFVDDAQWADAVSMEALAFAARRLTDHPVQFVLTRRAGFERTPLEAVLVRGRLVQVEPPPLQREEVARLLVQELGLQLTPRVLRLVHERSRGNPLFALEIGRVLVARGVPAIGEPLGVPEEMASVLGLRVRALPQAQQTLLLLLALDPGLPESVIVEIVGRETLEAAFEGRLVTLAERGRIRPWHPLLAEVAREQASPGRRADLHWTISQIDTRPGPRARHLALAVRSQDESLLPVLDAESKAAAAGGAVEAGVELAELALAGTPADSPDRPRRVLALATRLADAAEGARLTEFLAAEIDGLPHGRVQAEAWLRMLDGVVGSMANVLRFVDRALEVCGEADDVRARALDWKALLHVGMLVAGVDEALTWAEEACALGYAGEGRNWCLVHAGRRPEGDGMPAHKRLVWRGEPAAAEAWLTAGIARHEAEGRFRPAMSMRLHLLDLLVRAGRIEEARAVLSVLDDADLRGKESPDEEAMHALLEAAAGEAAQARAWADLAATRAAEFGHVWLGLDARRARAVAALVQGDLEEAEAEFSAVWRHAVTHGVRDPGIFPVAGDLVECRALLGQEAAAAEVRDWLAVRSAEQQHPWGSAMLGRVDAVLDLLRGRRPAAEAAAAAEAVAARFEELGLLHDGARTRLVVGSVLRRQRQWGLARTMLTEAVDRFHALDAGGWAELARAEEARVGGRQRRPAGELSPAEQRTAQLAADGLSNKEIARRTGVSIGTVEAHLSRAYAKLGVRSRSQLVGVFRD